MKSTGFLNTLTTEIIDAKNGNGKSVSTVKNYCDTVYKLLTILEENIVIKSDSSEKTTYSFSNINLDAENKEVFKELILDLNERKIVNHKEDVMIEKYPKSKESVGMLESRKMMQTTRTTNEMIDGKNIVVVDKIGFRKYVSQIKKIIDIVNTAKNNDVGMYSKVNEDIHLKTIGITIKGNHILKGDKKEEINVTDKALIYYLYYKSLKNIDECFSLKDLSISVEINKSEKYIENRIIEINKKIRQIISKIVKARIGKFIKKEPGRGYHLNPKILYKKSTELKK